MATDIVGLLERVQSPDDALRNEAEQLLKRMELEDYRSFLISLCSVFASEDRPMHIQRLAVIIFKNVLDSKEKETKEMQTRRWVELEREIKAEIRNEILKALHHPEVELARTVSMLVAKVAKVDVPRSEWPELIPTLLQNMTMESPPSALRQATLETLGYFCEEMASVSSFELNQDSVNSILTAVVRGMLKEESDDEVRLAATKALTNALEFAQTNFCNEQERTYIMQVVCDGIVCATSEDIRIASYECLIRICESYYDYLPPYMHDVFKLTMHSIQADTEDVAKQAVELWCTLCDEELELQEELEQRVAQDSIVLHHIVRHVYTTLVPLLLQQLTKQDEDQEMDESAWTLSMAAGACLDLVALVISNDVVPLVMKYCDDFMEIREGPESWRQREAAMFALGSILEGANSPDLLHFISQKFEVILNGMQDPDPTVRNTTAWTLGRIFEFSAFMNDYAPILSPENLDRVVVTLAKSLNDEPHIANRVCFAMSQLAECLPLSQGLSLSHYFQDLITALINVVFKHVPDRYVQTCLQVSAFDAVNGMVRGAPDDCLETVFHMVPLLVEKLHGTLNASAADDSERIPDIQSMLCGCLGVVLRRLEARDDPGQLLDTPSADSAMQVLLALFQSKNATVHEEAMLAVGSLSFAVKAQFSRYLEQFMPFLEIGLRNYQEVQVCIASVGTLSNICQAVKGGISCYCRPIMEILIATLQSNSVEREIKPHVLSTFADIALAMGPEFGEYINVVATILKAAVDLSIQNGGTIDEAFREFNVELRRSIIEAFSGILQGIGRSEAERNLQQESQYMIDFLECVVSEAPRDEMITTTAVGLLGDIAHSLPSLSPVMKEKKWIDAFVRECMRHVSQSVKDSGKWAAAAIANAAKTTATSA